MTNKVIIACITFFLISCGTGNHGLLLLVDSSTDIKIEIEGIHYFTTDDISNFALFQAIGDVTEDIQTILNNNDTVEQIQIALEKVSSNSNTLSLGILNSIIPLLLDATNDKIYIDELTNWVDVTVDLTELSIFQTDGDKTVRFTFNFYSQDGIISNSARRGYEEIVVVFNFFIDNTPPELESFTATTDILPVIEKLDFSLTFSEALKQQLSMADIRMNVDGTREIVWTNNRVVDISLYPQLGAREKNLEVSIDTIIEDLAGNTTILSQELYDLDVIAPEIINIVSEEITEESTGLNIIYSFSEAISVVDIDENSLTVSAGTVTEVEHLGDRIRFRVELPVMSSLIYSLGEYKDLAGNIGEADGNYEVIFSPYIKGISEIKEVATKHYEFTLYFSEEISGDSFTIADISHDSARLSLTLTKEAGDIEDATVAITYQGEDTSATNIGVGIGRFSNYKGENDRIWSEEIDPLAPNIVEIIGIRDINQDSNGEFTVSLKFSENVQLGELYQDLYGIIENSNGINVSATYDYKSYEATFDFEVAADTEGAVSFDVTEGSYKDFSGNDNREAIISFPQVMEVDVKSPSASIGTLVFDAMEGEIFYYSLEVNFSEEVSFNKSLEITGDGIDASFDFFGTRGIYTIKVDGTGEVGLFIQDGDYRDLVGNYNEEINGAIQRTELFDGTPFIIDIESFTDIEQEKFQLKFTFSRALKISTFEVDEILNINTNILSHSIIFGDSSRDATIDLMVLDDSIGEVTVDIVDGIYQSREGATNKEILSFPQHFSFDRVGLFIQELPLQSIIKSDVVGDKFFIDITFNKPIVTQGFDLSTVFLGGDITAESIIFSSSSDAKVYFQVPADLEKMVSIQAIDFRYEDVIGNKNIEKYSIDISIDLKAPFVKQKIVPSHSLYNKNNLLANESVEVALHFSELIQQNTLNITEIVTTLLSMSQINPSIVFHAEGKDATAGFVITEGLEGSIVMHISEGIYTDILGNGNEEQLSPQDLTAIIDIDTQSPSTLLGGVSPIITVENFSLSLTFSEEIEPSTLSVADIVEVSGGINVVLDIAADNQSAALDFTIPSGVVGTVSIDIADGIYEDLAGNENEESAPIKEVIDIDRQFPFVSSIEENQVGDILEVILNLSEEIETGSFPSLANIISVDGTLLLTDIVMTLDVSAVELAINVGGKTGSVTIDIADGSYQDKSANDNKEKETVFPHVITIDNAAPYIISTDLTSQVTINKNSLKNGSVSFELNFSENISADTISLDNIITIPVTITGALFVTEDVGKLVLTIPENIEGIVDLHIKDNVYKDLAGNTNVEILANLEREIRVDTKPPSTNIGNVPSLFPDFILPPIEFSFSESINVDTLTTADIVSVNGDISAELVFTDENRKATLSLSRSGLEAVTVTIDIETGDYEDEAGNENEEAPPIQRIVLFQGFQLDELIAASECDKVFFDGGEGTKNAPYKISNICHLQNIAEDTITKLDYTDLLSSHYELTTNIDATATQGWNGMAGFIPIGDATDSFTGSFDGQGFTIENLYINRPTDYSVGLFSDVENANINSLILVNVGVTGDSYVGGIIGRSDGSTISDSTVDGSVNGNNNSGYGYVGGLIGGTHGTNGDTVTNSIFNGSVSGYRHVGGLIGGTVTGGTGSITVTNSIVNGNVKGNSRIGGLIGKLQSGIISNGIKSGGVVGVSNVGGLVGLNGGDILASTVNGSVGGTGDYVGGLIGRSGGSIISNNTVNGSVEGNDNVGGLIGRSDVDTVTNSIVNGSVEGDNDVGGLVGNNKGNISDSEVNGSVGSEGGSVGGLIGYNDGGIISHSIANSDVEGSNGHVGGLIGNNSGGSVSDSEANGSVKGEGTHVGGLIGYNDGGTISNSMANSDVEGSNEHVGGLIGNNSGGSVSDSEAYGSVEGDKNNIGGLIGYNNGGTIFDSTAGGNVAGEFNVGGLIGNNSGSVSDSEAYGSVEGIGNNVGDLIGSNTGSVSHSEAYGSVEGGSDRVGGLIGYNAGAVSDSEANGSVEGKGNNVGGLIGYNIGVVSDSTANGSVESEGNNVGGLIGNNNNATISDSEANGSVEGKGSDVGGLIGNNTGPVSTSTANGSVEGDSNSVGGLIGNNTETVSYSEANGNVVGDSNSVGGLIGNNTGTVSYSEANGNVVGDRNNIGGVVGNYVGGLIGDNSGNILNNVAHGNTEGNVEVGGLVGRNNGGDISGSIAHGNVRGKSITTGGLVGISYGGMIKNNIAGGNVFGVNQLGGLIGSISGSVDNSYSLSFVNGLNTQVGGLLGLNSGILNNNYWNIETSTQSNGIGNGSSSEVVGVTIFDMLNSTGNATDIAFQGWAADGVWDFGGSNDYPIINGSADFEDLQAVSIAHGLLRISGVNDESDDFVGYTYSIVKNTFSVGYVTNKPIGMIDINSAATNNTDTMCNISDNTVNSFNGTKITLEGSVFTLNTACEILFVAEPQKNVLYELKLTISKGNTEISKVYEVEPQFSTDIASYLPHTVETQNYTFLLPYLIENFNTYLATIDDEDANFTVVNNELRIENISINTDPSTFTIHLLEGALEFTNGFINEEVNIIVYNIVNQVTHGSCTAVEFDGGMGTEADPYQISNICHLQNINEDNITPNYTNLLSSHYELTENVDATAVHTWNSGAGFIPIGNDTSRFIGSFDGQGFTIENLYINRPGEDYVGLFAVLDDASIDNLVLFDIDITGQNYTGGLIGRSFGSTISDSTIDGNVEGSGSVGGLVGRTEEATDRIYKNTVNINVTGGNSVGGLVGRGRGTFSENTVSGTVEGEEGVGGLVGYNVGDILNSIAHGNIEGNSAVGGLVGFNYGTINNSIAVGDVSGDTEVGGLIGNVNVAGSIDNSYSLSFVNGNTQVGGLIGANSGTLNNNYWNTETSTQSNGIGNGSSSEVVGVTIFDMLNSTGNATDTAFQGWAADGVWDFGGSNDYPIIDGSADFEDLQAVGIAYELLRISGVNDESDDFAGDNPNIINNTFDLTYVPNEPIGMIDINSAATNTMCNTSDNTVNSFNGTKIKLEGSVFMLNTECEISFVVTPQQNIVYELELTISKGNIEISKVYEVTVL